MNVTFTQTRLVALPNGRAKFLHSVSVHALFTVWAHSERQFHTESPLPRHSFNHVCDVSGVSDVSGVRVEGDLYVVIFRILPSLRFVFAAENAFTRRLHSAAVFSLNFSFFGDFMPSDLRKDLFNADKNFGLSFCLEVFFVVFLVDFLTRGVKTRVRGVKTRVRGFKVQILLFAIYLSS